MRIHMAGGIFFMPKVRLCDMPYFLNLVCDMPYFLQGVVFPGDGNNH